MKTRLVSRTIAVFLACLLGLQLFSIVQYLNEEIYLSSLMDNIAAPYLPPSEQVIKVLGFLKEKPDIGNSSYFLLPAFGFLRATPRQVAEQGGDCADRSRLVIRLLRVHGIKAAKWALYSKDMKPQHAAVELEAETGKMVVDPLFGVWFPRTDGGYYGIKELRRSPALLQDRIQALLENGDRPGTSDLKLYPLDKYVYENARSINWNKWSGTRILYDALRAIMGPAIDNLPRPAFVEIPQLMVVMIAAVVQGGLVALYLFFVRMNKKGD